MAIVQAPTKARFFLTGEPAILAHFGPLPGWQAPKAANFSCPAAFIKRVQCKMNPGDPRKPHNIKVLQGIRRATRYKRGPKSRPWNWDLGTAVPILRSVIREGHGQERVMIRFNPIAGPLIRALP